MWGGDARVVGGAGAILRRLPHGRSLPAAVWGSVIGGSFPLSDAGAALPLLALARGYPLWHSLAEAAVPGRLGWRRVLGRLGP